MSATVLVLLGRAEAAAACLAAAGQVAAAYDHATLAVLHVRVDPAHAIVPGEEVLTAQRRRTIEGEEQTRAAALAATFDDWRRTAGPAASAARWIEVTGDVVREIERHGHDADLVVLGQAPGLRHLPDREAIGAALFDSRRPILLVPAGWRGDLGRRVAIAWKPAAQARRAVVAALPILRQAAEIVALIGDGEAAADEAALQSLLVPHGIVAAIHRFDPGSAAIGEALLREARRHGVDLLVMGAYSHSRIYELILGGVTRHMLGHADMPLLMVH
jgi:nucleotide-binding universal stress UspA family protein